MLRRHKVIAYVAGAAVVALLAGLAACSNAVSADEGQLADLTNRCVSQMAADTCRTMSVDVSRAAGEVVLVAGVGPVDGRLLASLRAAGQGMCADVRAECARDWNSAPCKSLRALYSS